MDTKLPRRNSKQKKTVIALSALTCGLLSLIGYEVFSQYSSPIHLENQKKESRPLIILDDDAEDGYAVADLGYSIGKTQQNDRQKDTVESLKYQLNDNSRQLGNLRTHLLTKGSLTDHPRVADLKKQLADAQMKYQVMLDKKRLLKDELMRLKELHEEKNEQFRQLAFKKKELKDQYFALHRQLKNREQALRETAQEAEQLKVLLINAENAKSVSDATNAKIMNRLQKLKDDLAFANKSNHALERTVYEMNAELDDLRYRLANNEKTFQNLVQHHISHVRGNTDELTSSISATKSPLRSLYVNIEKGSQDISSAENAARHYDLLNKLNQLSQHRSNDQPALNNAVSDAADHPSVGLNKDLLDKVQKLEDELTYANMDNVALESTIHALQQELAQLRSTKSDYENELVEHRAKSAYDNELAQAVPVEEHEHAQNELETSQMCNSALENAIGRLNKQVTYLKEKLKVYEDTHTSDLELHDEHNDKIVELDSSLHAATLCNDAFTRIVEKQNAQIAKLQDELNIYKQKAQEIDEDSILKLKEELLQASESAQLYEHSVNNLNRQLESIRGEEREKLQALQDNVHYLQRQLTQERYANQPAPGIRQQLPLSAKHLTNPRTASSQVAHMCSQVSKLGSSALALCNRSPEELLREALAQQARSKTLENQIDALSKQLRSQEEQIRQLEDLLNARQDDEEEYEDTAELADNDDDYGYDDGFYGEHMLIHQESRNQNFNDGTAIKSKSEKALNEETDSENDLEEEVDELDDLYDTPPPGGIDLLNSSDEELDAFEREIEGEDEESLALAEDEDTDSTDEDEDEDFENVLARDNDEDEDDDDDDEEDEDEDEDVEEKASEELALNEDDEEDEETEDYEDGYAESEEDEDLNEDYADADEEEQEEVEEDNDGFIALSDIEDDPIEEKVDQPEEDDDDQDLNDAERELFDEEDDDDFTTDEEELEESQEEAEADEIDNDEEDDEDFNKDFLALNDDEEDQNDADSDDSYDDDDEIDNDEEDEDSNKDFLALNDDEEDQNDTDSDDGYDDEIDNDEDEDEDEDFNKDFLALNDDDEDVVNKPKHNPEDEDDENFDDADEEDQDGDDFDDEDEEDYEDDEEESGREEFV